MGKMTVREMSEEADRLRSMISELPVGYISRKTINGKVRLYHQWYEDGKVRSRYLKEGEAEPLSEKIERRKSLQLRLKTLEGRISDAGRKQMNDGYYNQVLRGYDLLQWAQRVDGWRRRDCYAALKAYIDGDDDHVCVLYGLRRTGKTTLIRQAVMEMSDDELGHAAYIRVESPCTMMELRSDIAGLCKEDPGLRVIFIDEVTLIPDFVDGAAALSDCYVEQGMRIVLSGTDSLGFWFSQGDVLMDRILMIHTTYIPFREHSRLLLTADVDHYIESGGTLSSGQMYMETGCFVRDEYEFTNSDSVDRYSCRAIAENIQNSLRVTRGGTFLEPFRNLYDAGELTNVINRVVEDLNHRFVLEVVDEEYGSRDFSESATNLSGDGEHILDEVDRRAVVESLKRKLSILDADERSVPVTEGQMGAIRLYLMAMDVIAEYRREIISREGDAVKGTLIIQPGLRYAQAKALVDSLNEDEVFRAATRSRRHRVLERVTGAVKGHILEEVVIHDTSTALGDGYEVFKFEMPGIREVDMVVYEIDTERCLLFEIKHTGSRIDKQYRHLVHPEVSKYMADMYGQIAGRYVLYRGESTAGERRVGYLNVSDYLRNPCDHVRRLLSHPHRCVDQKER